MVRTVRLGIDFGTTRTVVAAVEDGNHPVVSFEDAAGDLHDHVPTVVALGPGHSFVSGWTAQEAVLHGAPSFRTLKRLLADPATTGRERITLGTAEATLSQLLWMFAADLRTALVEHSSLDLDGEERLEIALGVPAHAPSAQRFLTIDAFTRAGFDVLGLVNEPTAAAFEFLHRYPKQINSQRQSVIVYDLGGGTFDASMVQLGDAVHEVDRTLGLPNLGGEDFDALLAELALEHVPDEAKPHSDHEVGMLQEAARIAKERLTPQSRRLVLEVGDSVITIPVDEFSARAEKLVLMTLDTIERLLGGLDQDALAQAEVAGLYLVGGASSLPLVPRMMRERFARRVHRSPQAMAATAIGLALYADPDAQHVMRERLGRGIGVFREREGGAKFGFDVLIEPGSRVDTAGELRARREYRAAHNIGSYRFLEFTELAGDDTPAGELVQLAHVLVPFTAALSHLGADDLANAPIQRLNAGPLVEEELFVDANGIAHITMRVPALEVKISRRIDLAVAQPND
ncbi:Hsp70 family protein [Pseudoclavibacter alba]|uniref:Hsp70 family protein n=1 Tax=Pseudoclavibacter albus TaxID=272241 RepID=UPI0019D20160|nr:Hsp70 family protein [Pseudoclavibacter alba]MBN6778071.1 Hsp70 family protein [Pseudoclavibacter alba]